jgi:hypothetical protein
LSPANRDAANSNATFDAYSGTITINRGLGPENFPYTARLLNLAATNPTLKLTYSGLGSYVMPVDTVRNITDRHYFVYGVPTPSLNAPRSGTGTYVGIALGTGIVETRNNNGSTHNLYDLAGTNVFNANFASSAFTSTLQLTGTDRSNGASVNFSPYSFNGTIFRQTFTTADNGRTMNGSFFGQNAEEMGAYFRIFDTVIGANPTDTVLSDFYGAIVGKRCPTAVPC